VLRTVLILILGVSSSCGGGGSGGGGSGDDGDDPPGSIDAAPPVDAPPSARCTGKAAQPLDATWMIGARTANVHVPASYDPGTATPVVLNIHGRTGSATGQATMSHAIAKSDAAGFILVHPQSATVPTSWNAGTCCDPATTTNVADVAFIAALLDELEARLCVDPDRVYSMGMSNGGYLSHRLACELADRIAAIGPVAGLKLIDPCQPSRPVPAMLVNGTADFLSVYQFVQAGVDFWADRNACTTTQQTFQNGDATCVTRGGCTGGADVVLCTIADGGHQWPGGDELPLLGKKSDDLITTDALWDFFVAHPRK
jgi:polyhydroxybutyrate depolymerase